MSDGIVSIFKIIDIRRLQRETLDIWKYVQSFFIMFVFFLVYARDSTNNDRNNQIKV